MAIHPTAIISPQAEIAADCEIGPYCVIGDRVVLGAGARLHSHVVIESDTIIGERCEAFPFAALGGRTQDLKYKGERTQLVIGDDNTFRENSTIHRGTTPDTPTRIGSHNYFLCYSHVAHECIVGDHTIFSNNATIAGHVTVGDHAIISGLSAVHQFCRVGEHSMTAGLARVVQDVPPFMIVDGNPSSTRGLNIVGLQRRGFSEEDIRALKMVYKKLFLKKDLNLGEQVKAFRALPEAQNERAARVLDFIESSDRGIVR
ncbi:acyl-ACP--UDP-N-acetylglucosamine O-acyltransferase [Roseibacillus ishigakijimensis]|uniref:Acyl-[acyl-carrier-protein]--UDP-N-acetylglucosamine O-acyltransferase n=1 Tax=Roseibacillus ishigakijimensis TaxID=454146 RepID=A0A934RMT7_9BACT|nr:acyl-ACP--UDP-N-acetylglucosamine O-acyltransferase [Roseibacillus ishigakijimensis]MBK1833693.1 acyl-ACP--UDP-N-acetylglucosamine O-acyltransferase [Roseibacillus ishigakijimensis]